MFNLLSLVSHNPPVVLYILQAGTYGAAAAFVRRDDHHSLTKCYLITRLRQLEFRFRTNTEHYDLQRR